MDPGSYGIGMLPPHRSNVFAAPKMDLVEIPEDLPEGEYLCLDLKAVITTIKAFGVQNDGDVYLRWVTPTDWDDLSGWLER